jgi:hypothetical protein
MFTFFSLLVFCSKAEMRRDIVAGTVGFRSRSAAMSGGAWT